MSGTLRGCPHEKRSFAKTHTYCIVLVDRPHGSWKCSAWKSTFLKTGLRREKSENAALAFSCGWRIRILSETMTPSPHPSTSSLRPLNPAMSHNNYNKTMAADNMLVLVLQQILSLLGLLGQNILLLCLGLPVYTIVVFFVWFLLYCLFVQSESFLRMLRVFFSIFGECQAPPIGLEYELQRFQSFSVEPCGRKYS